MATMATTAGPGGTSQSTITTPGLALQDPNDFMKFAYANALRRYQLQQQQQAPRAAPMMAAPQAAAPVAREPVAQDATSKLADYMDARKRILEDQEAAAPPPMRMINGGPGISQGYTMDVNAMSGSQRKMFLPQSSQFAAIDSSRGGGGGGEGSARDPGSAAAADPLTDPYSDAYRSLVSQGYSAPQIAQMRQQNLAARGGR